MERVPTETRTRRRLLTWVRRGALALLTAHLLFAHGCHGDEDHELFGVVRVVVGE